MVEVLVGLSVLSVLLGLLVLRGYFPHVHRGEWENPVAWLATGFVIINGAWVARTGYWDIIWYLMGNSPSDPLVNIWLILSVIGSQFCALIARLKTIPPSDRSRYNLFTAPFYPNEIWRIGGNRK